MTKNRHDLTPEHTARKQSGDFLPEVEAAYYYVDRVAHTADMYSPFGGYAWNGWALREAFLAGCSHARTPTEANGELTDQELLRCFKIGTPCYNVEGWRKELEGMRAVIAADRALRGKVPSEPRKRPTDEELDELEDAYYWLDANHSKPWIPFARTVLDTLDGSHD